MTRRLRWAILLLTALLGLGAVALARAGSPYGGHVLYLRLRLTPYLGSVKEIQYWIDAAGGRIRYAEMMPQSGTIRAFVNGVPVRPSPPQWFIISLARRSDGQCGVTYTTILDSSERNQPVPCADLLALRDAATLKARMLALWKQYPAGTRVGSGAAVSVTVPLGVDPIPLLAEHLNMRYGYESLRAGTVALDRRSGLPLSIGVYRRDGSNMAVQVLEARDLPPGALPGDFFDPPLFSLPDRFPGLYQWLRAHLPWRI